MLSRLLKLCVCGYVCMFVCVCVWTVFYLSKYGFREQEAWMMFSLLFTVPIILLALYVESLCKSYHKFSDKRLYNSREYLRSICISSVSGFPCIPSISILLCSLGAFFSDWDLIVTGLLLENLQYLRYSTIRICLLMLACRLHFSTELNFFCSRNV